MNDRHRRGLLSEIGMLALWAAVICLVGSLIGWLLQRRATAWFGMVLLFYVPISLGVAMVINTFIYAIDADPWPDLCSDRLFQAEAILGLVVSVVVGIAVTTDSKAPARESRQFTPRRCQR